VSEDFGAQDYKVIVEILSGLRRELAEGDASSRGRADDMAAIQLGLLAVFAQTGAQDGVKEEDLAALASPPENPEMALRQRLVEKVDDATGWFLLATELSQQRNFKHVESILNFAAALSSKDPYKLLNLAREFFDAGFPDAANRTACKVLTETKNHPQHFEAGEKALGLLRLILIAQKSEPAAPLPVERIEPLPN
jgi:hypothetical protein